MTRNVTQALMTTGLVLLFIATLAELTLRDAAAVTIMIYPFAHLFCKYVIRES